jgi:hypothetical protein
MAAVRRLAMLGGAVALAACSGTSTLADETGSTAGAGVATCNDVVVWAGLFAGMTVLSASGDVLGDISLGDRAFGQAELGPLTFYGNQLVIASTAGLDFYALDPIP